ncbi:MAG: LCP family protein [Candidatus Saccharibacteria bacterium]
MNKKNASTDGFIPRRSGDQLGSLHDERNKRYALTDISENRPLHTNGGDINRPIGEPQTGRGLGRSDIDESLNDIDDDKAPVKKLSRRQRRRLAGQVKRPRSLARRIIKWLIILIILAALSAGGYVAYKFYGAGSNILQGSFLDILKNQPLKQDSNGRSNFLILGTSEDDPGHDGANLTDSMLVVSIDQNNKNIYMFSVPRDLYVKYGMACVAGYSGKINSYFSCVDDGTTAEAEQDRLTQTQKFVGDIFGMDIQYGIHVNHTVIKEAIDAVGGVDVDIEGSNGDSGVLDRNFDWRCKYTCYLVKYDNGTYHLDGEHALYLSMARGDVAPTYGLSNSNFDREKNQQKILMALKDKAMTTGTLTNLSAVTKLIDTFGANLRTNIQTSEIRTLMQISSEVKTADIFMLSLVGADNSVVTTGNYDGASVVMPSAGIYDYSEIQSFIKKNITSDPIVKEAAPIVVLNGTGQTGYAQTQADTLTAAGYTVSSVDNAPDGTYDKVEIYQIGTANVSTAAKLSKTYNVTIKTTKPPVLVTGDVKFVIIFGATS